MKNAVIRTLIVAAAIFFAHPVAAQAAKLVKLIAALDASSVKGKQAKHYKSIPTKLKQTAAALRKAKGLEPTRDAFKKLSRSMVLWATLSKPKGVVVI